MPGITITGTFKKGTQNQGSFAITKSDALLIALQNATDIPARDSLPEYLRMSFMLCYVVSENKTYRLGADTTIAGQVWTQASGDFILLTEKGAPDGVVPLDANSKINPIYLDTLNLSSTFVVADIDAMLNDITTYRGNLVIVQDASADPEVASGSATYARIDDVASPTLANFLRVEYGASVTSVNGLIGAVSIDFDQLLTWGASTTQFNTAVSNNVTVLQNAADIQTNQTDILTLDTIKADLIEVLTLTNVASYTPTSDYHPATKKYVDEATAIATMPVGGVEGSIQVNNTDLLTGFSNFLYQADVLSVPTIKLTSLPDTDNAIDFVIVRDNDGTLKKRAISTIIASGGGHTIQNEGIAVTNRNNLNFVGNLVNLTDDIGNDAIIITIRDPLWGDIGGTISNQTDLQDELNLKADEADLIAHTDLTDEHIDWSISGAEQVAADRLPPAASGDVHFAFDQASTALTWTINHNLGKRPSVITTDVDGNEFYGTIEHVTNNQVKIYYSVAVSGKAYLN